MTIPKHMTAVQLMDHGGIDQLVINHQAPVPQVNVGEVLIKVAAAGINNTDINTRIGWYSKEVTTDTATGGSQGFEKINVKDAAWSGRAIQLPRIQGADVCGEIIAIGDGVASSRIGERVIVRSMQDFPDQTRPMECFTFGSECDGGYAQYTKAFSNEAWAVKSAWSDAELASIPCAYSTAENMLQRAKLQSGETVLITGASGGVGSAAVQLAKCRGAKVIAMASAKKAAVLENIGADQVLDREADIGATLGHECVDLVVDLVAGPHWPKLLDTLKRGGRYATAGAIAGPIVELDVRTLYLKDLTFIGCTYQDRDAFRNLINYIENNQIKPLVAKTYPLVDVHIAQLDFLQKNFVGKLVLIP